MLFIALVGLWSSAPVSGLSEAPLAVGSECGPVLLPGGRSLPLPIPPFPLRPWGCIGGLLAGLFEPCVNLGNSPCGI
jgi:hypothetical protein